MADGEEMLTCTQCTTTFQESENVEGACRFHALPESRNCCQSGARGCCSGRHRAEHHCEYPYGNFIQRFQDVTNYTDTCDEWLKVKDEGMGGKMSMISRVMLIRKWKTRTASLAEPLLGISVQFPWYCLATYLDH